MQRQRIMPVRVNKLSGQMTVTIPQGVNLFPGDFLSFTIRGDKVNIKKVVL